MAFFFYYHFIKMFSVANKMADQRHSNTNLTVKVLVVGIVSYTYSALHLQSFINMCHLPHEGSNAPTVQGAGPPTE